MRLKIKIHGEMCGEKESRMKNINGIVCVCARVCVCVCILCNAGAKMASKMQNMYVFVMVHHNSLFPIREYLFEVASCVPS